MNTNKRESKSRETSFIGVDSRPFADKGVEALAGRDHKIWPVCLSSSGGRLNKDASPMRPYSRIVQSSMPDVVLVSAEETYKGAQVRGGSVTCFWRPDPSYLSFQGVRHAA